MNKYIVAMAYAWHGGYGQPVEDDLRVLVVSHIDSLSADVLATWGGIETPIQTIEAEDGFHAGIAYLIARVEARIEAKVADDWLVSRIVVDADGDCTEYVPRSGVWIKED